MQEPDGHVVTRVKQPSKADIRLLVRRIGRVSTVALLTAVVMLLSPVDATAEGRQVHQQTSGVGTSFAVAVRTRGTGDSRGQGCTATGTVWAQEYMKSGVTRFKARWELRGYYDSGMFPTHGSVGWWRSASFPNDYLSCWVDFALPYGYLNFAAGKQFSLWAKAVGERPSWWRPDLTRRVRVGEPACSWGVPAA